VLLPHCRQGQRGQCPERPNQAFRLAPLAHDKQGSNIFILAAQPRVGLGLKIDQGRSLLRAPRRCLRSLVAPRLTFARRLRDSLGLDSGRDLVSEPPQYTEALGLTSSRSSDYSLVKERFHFTSQTSASECFIALAVGSLRQGRRIIASAGLLSTGVARNSWSHADTRADAIAAASESLGFKGCCRRNMRPSSLRPSSGTRNQRRPKNGLSTAEDCALYPARRQVRQTVRQAITRP